MRPRATAWTSISLFVWMLLTAPAPAAESVVLRLLEPPRAEVVIARVDFTKSLAGLTAPGDQVPQVRAVALADGQEVEAQFVPDPALTNRPGFDRRVPARSWCCCASRRERAIRFA